MRTAQLAMILGCACACQHTKMPQSSVAGTGGGSAISDAKYLCTNGPRTVQFDMTYQSHPGADVIILQRNNDDFDFGYKQVSDDGEIRVFDDASTGKRLIMFVLGTPPIRQIIVDVNKSDNSGGITADCKPV